MGNGLIDPFGEDVPATPKPAPSPDSSLQSLVVPAGCHTALAAAGVVIISVVLTALLMVWWLSDGPTSTVNAQQLGRDFAPILAGTMADGFDAEAAALEAGKDITEANAALKAAFDSGRKAAFEQHAGSLVTSLVPDGQTIPSDEVRRALVQAHRDFAKGLREAK